MDKFRSFKLIIGSESGLHDQKRVGKALNLSVHPACTDKNPLTNLPFCLCAPFAGP